MLRLLSSKQSGIPIPAQAHENRRPNAVPVTQNGQEKLDRLRPSNLQKILTREQYLKYEALDKDKIRKLPLRLTE